MLKMRTVRMQAQYTVQSCWLLASFPEENSSSTSFSQGIASRSPCLPPNQAAKACIWKNLEIQQRNMWNVCLPRVWHLKNTSRIIPGVFHPQRSPCSCSFTHDTLCQSLAFLKAPFCPPSRRHAVIPYTCPTFCLSKVVKVQSSQAGFRINLHLTLLVLFIPSQSKVHWKLRH